MLHRTATIDGPRPWIMPRQALALGFLATALFALALWAQGAPTAQTAAVPDADYGNLPVSFVPNKGQTDGSVRYTAQGGGYAFNFGPDKVALSFAKGKRGTALHLTPLGANQDARLEPGERRQGTVNYFANGERHTGLPTYGELTYRELWPGVDMVFRGAAGTLKYEFHVRPGADPSKIRLAYRGADGLSLGAAGNLLIATPLGTLRDSRPRSYQMVDGERVAVHSKYELQGAAGYGFALGSTYDPGRPLVIDPGLTYSTFLGGSVHDQGNGIAVDAGGNAYVTGQANSSNFPTTAGAFDTTFNAQTEVFVTKLNAAGTAMSYSTYLGGTGDDIGRGIVVDAFGSAYVTGTAQTGFPTTAGALDTTIAGSDAFVTKLNASGSALLYSTFLGGGSSDNGQGIAVDANGQAYVAGDTLSTVFPTTAGAFDQTGGGPNFDGFVSKLNSAGSSLVYSTYLGGTTAVDTATSIALGTGGTAHVAGRTISTDFPTTAGAFDTTFNGGANDAFATKLNATGSALDYSTYLGGTGDELLANVAVDTAGSAYVGGATSSADYPSTAGAFDPFKDSGTDIFVTKLNSTGSAPVYSTFIGAGGSDIGHDIAVDADANVFVTGVTTSSSFPVSPGAFDTSHNGSGDVLVFRLNAAGSALTHSTFLGTSSTETGRAVAVDGNANAFVTGDTPGATFPVTAGAPDTTHNGSADVFAAKLNMTPTAQPGYVRPMGASPLRVPLVPAFTSCTSPNRVHGLPDLPGGTNPDGSCAPPAQQSNYVTIGTPDSNGKPANSVGFFQLKTLTGNAATSVDEADIELTAEITDVRNKTALTDYTGELVTELDLSITDRFHGPTHTETGTIQNIKFRVPLICAPTPGPQDIGSTCAVNTTADAVTPSSVRESLRSVWSLGQVLVSDGGADGDFETTPNGVFARQGILIP